MSYERIWLIGFMGTGKSRIARPLAVALDWDWVDVDTLIEERAGDSIAGIFRTGGEGAFRVIESQVIEDLSERQHVVIATGGGSVLADMNRAAMRKDGFVVCLDARPETIANRLGQPSAKAGMAELYGTRIDADPAAPPRERPLLAGGDPLGRIVELKGARQSLYAQADFIIQTDDLTPDQVTHQILLAYRERAGVAGGTAPA
jgi:shikimate kinase